MIVVIADGECLVYREDGDRKYRPNYSKRGFSAQGWYGAESQLLHTVKKILRGRGLDVIKKRMWRDGHMFGSDETQYIRTRNLKVAPSFYIYHASYETEISAENYNVLGRAVLDVEDEVLDGNEVGKEKMERVAKETRAFLDALETKDGRQVFEVSWMDTVKIDGERSEERCYKAFEGFNHQPELSGIDTATGAAALLYALELSEKKSEVQLREVLTGEKYRLREYMTPRQVAGKI